jgi:hypothetical protein
LAILSLVFADWPLLGWISKAYPSGIAALIPVGIITEIISKKNDIDRYGIVDVFVDIESLDLVGIITN